MLDCAAWMSTKPVSYDSSWFWRRTSRSAQTEQCLWCSVKSKRSSRFTRQSISTEGQPWWGLNEGRTSSNLRTDTLFFFIRPCWPLNKAALPEKVFHHVSLQTIFSCFIITKKPKARGLAQLVERSQIHKNTGDPVQLWQVICPLSFLSLVLFPV